MTLYKIIPTIISVCGCIGNSFRLTFFMLYENERKGLTNKLFMVLSIWDFLNSTIVAIRVWIPDNTRYFMTPMYAWVLKNNHFVFIMIAITRMIKICAPFYRIKKKAVWAAMIIDFTFRSTMELTLHVKGEFAQADMFSMDPWQVAKFANSFVWNIVFILGVLIPNIISGIKLIRPGSTAISKTNAQAVKTVMIISTIFLLSNGLLYLHIARNIKYVAQQSLQPLIPGYNAFLGRFFFRLMMMLNAFCDPIVFFIRNKNFRDFVLRIPRSIKSSMFSKVMTGSSAAQIESGNTEQQSGNKKE